MSIFIYFEEKSTLPPIFSFYVYFLRSLFYLRLNQYVFDRMEKTGSCTHVERITRNLRTFQFLFSSDLWNQQVDSLHEYCGCSQLLEYKHGFRLLLLIILNKNNWHKYNLDKQHVKFNMEKKPYLNMLLIQWNAGIKMLRHHNMHLQICHAMKIKQLSG